MKFSLRAKAIASLGFLFALAALGYAALFWNNLTWLTDPHGLVQSARLAATNTAQPMARLPWGDFVAATRIEGTVEALCKDGTLSNGGYVTRNFGQTYTVTRDCQIEWVRPD